MPDCSMISMRMTQTSKAAHWKLQTSIKKPADKDITSLALVSKYEFQRENLLLRLPFIKFLFFEFSLFLTDIFKGGSQQQ